MKERGNGLFKQINNSLLMIKGNEKVLICPWGNNSFRVRGTKYPEFRNENNALTEAIENSSVTIKINGDNALINNGKITAKINNQGKIKYFNQHEEILLEEYLRTRNPSYDEEATKEKIKNFNSALMINSREFKPILGGDYSLTMRFESSHDEKIFGMGQYQHEYLNLKNCKLELAHRNSQTSIPFALSSKGFGFLWNNPAIGEVTFGKNITEWKAFSTKELDYWITAGDTPSEIIESYAYVTGTVPMIPEYGLGYWQSKLRYQTQEELLDVAREYKSRDLPIDVIVVDYYHWPLSGDFKFDKEYWPNPQKMIKELEEMDIKLMVSVWPTVDFNSENYNEMSKNGMLVQVERGVPITMDFFGNNGFIDPTNPETRDYVWELCKKNYYDLGIEIFWLDEAEPEYTVYDFDNYRYYEGTNLQVGNYYPVAYSKLFYDGLINEGKDKIINLVRSGWAGSQKYGALIWSGDIDSSFESLRNQVRIGLNMGLAGIPWWTTDIGGFHGGKNDNKSYRELIIRWFQFGAFSPIFRMHGDREPHSAPLGVEGGGRMPSGAATEVWEYGETAYNIMRKYMFIREELKPYIRDIMREAHKKGTPVIRTLFYEFPEDEKTWDIDDSYMFGDKLLVSPVLYEKQRSKNIYLPASSEWIDVYTKTIYKGGQVIKTELKLDKIPIFVKHQSDAEKFIRIFNEAEYMIK